MNAHRLARRTAKIQPSPTLAVTMKAQALRAQGIDVIGFGAGEPDFDTPEHVKAAAVEALRRGETKYTPVGGTPALKKAIASRLEEDFGVVYKPSEIVVGCGAKHVLFNLFQVLLDPGDEVVIQAPYWVSYPEMVQLADGVAAIVPTSAENGFRMTAAELERAITPRTRAVLLNSPSNPTGAAYGADELRALADVCVRHDLLIVSDEIYSSLTYDGRAPVCVAALSPEIRARTITVNGASKAYAMTGWRIGYACGAEPIVRAVTDLQSQSTSNPTSIAQAAAAAAFGGPQACVAEMRAAFERRRTRIVELLRAIPGVTCTVPEGAFYVFPDVSRFIDSAALGARKGSDALCEQLLEKHHIALVAGASFGADRHVRLSYATSMELIEKGLERLAAGLRALA
jgi:aspartate aminotransferase